MVSAASAAQPPAAAPECRTCAGCQVTSPYVAAFSMSRRRVPNPGYLCPRCATADALRRARRGLIGWLLLAAVALPTAIVGGPQDGAWGFVTALLAWPFIVATVVPHELGHALAALALRFQVASIGFGTGRAIRTWFVRGTAITLGQIPLGGATQIGTVHLQGLRLRLILVYLAGPAANVLCILVGVLLGANAATPRSFDAFRPGAVWTMINLTVIVLNLWPHKVDHRRLDSDGLQIWKLLRHGVSRETVDALTVGAPVVRATHLLANNQPRLALEVTRDALRRSPESKLAWVASSAALVGCAEFAEAEAACRRVLDAPAATDIDRACQAAANCNLGIVRLLSDDPADWAAARTHTQAAYSFLPWDEAVACAHAASVALAGTLEAGLEIVDRLVGRTPTLRVRRDAAIALVGARTGRLAEADAAYRRALAASKGYEGAMLAAARRAMERAGRPTA